jgi:mono/diheme cytochrome c family protein
MDVAQVIAKGVGEKGMPSWETILTRTELVAVAAYAFKLSNRNLPGKAPEGQLVELETR